MIKNDTIKNILLGAILLALVIPQITGRAMFSIALVDNEPQIVAEIQRMHKEQQELIADKLYDDYTQKLLIEKAGIQVMDKAAFLEQLQAQLSGNVDQSGLPETEQADPNGGN